MQLDLGDTISLSDKQKRENGYTRDKQLICETSSTSDEYTPPWAQKFESRLLLCSADQGSALEEPFVTIIDIKAVNTILPLQLCNGGWDGLSCVCFHLELAYWKLKEQIYLKVGMLT